MTKKLYAWDLRELDLATLSGDIVVHCSNEYKCRVTRAHADKVHVVCNPLGAMTIMRAGERLVLCDDSGSGTDRVCALTIGGAS
jgi:hypothetical protein